MIRPGDRVFFEPGEHHWHGAAPTRFMTHIAMVQVDAEGNAAAGATTSVTRSTEQLRLSRVESLSDRQVGTGSGLTPVGFSGRFFDVRIALTR